MESAKGCCGLGWEKDERHGVGYERENNGGASDDGGVER